MHLIFQGEVFRGFQLKVLGIGAQDGRAGGDFRKPILYPFQRLFGVYIARDRQYGVVGGIVLFEKLGYILHRSSAQIVHVADGRPVVGMAFRVQVFHQGLVGQAVGAVFIALAAFVFYHISLSVQLALRHGLEQIPHAVGLQEQGHVQGIGRKRFVVVGAVGRRRAIVAAANAFQQVVEIALFDIAGTFEHDVLKQMRETGTPGLFVA